MAPPEHDPSFTRLAAFSAYPPECEPEPPAISDNLTCGCAAFVVGLLAVGAYLLWRAMW